MRHVTIRFARACALALVAHAAHAADRIADPQAPVPPTGSEWPSYNLSVDGQRYSLLDQIDTGNAGQLAEVCRYKVDDTGSFQAGLVVIDDVMYGTTATDTFALDPTNCELIWRVHHRRARPAPFAVNRGVGYYAGRLFRGTDDGRFLALDARTGQELWSNTIGDPGAGELATGSPLVWNGLVITGTAVSEFGVRGRVMAYDAATGREVWRFNTVPAPGEPNSDTWRDTVWNDIGGGGGGTWSHFALDPTTGELFIPVGNPIPDFVPAERPGDNLYTNSVLVLDVFTGKLRWWYQLAPADGLDHDLASAPALYRTARGMRMAAGGKDGYLHIVDRRSHELIAKTAVTSVTEPVAVPTPEGIEACPGPAGGVEWNGPAYDPAHNLLFVGALDYCALFQSTPGTKPEIGGYNMGGTWTGLGTPRGWIHAVNADTGEIAWRYHADHPVIGAITPTAGGIVMGGDNAGKFIVFEAASGKVLKEIDTGGSLSGGVITYAVGGRQYVAVTSGNVSRSLFGAAGKPTVVVMALPEGAVASGHAPGVPNAKRGKALYYTTCAVCHGLDGNDWNNVDLKAVKRKMDFEALTAFILNPRAPMPKVFAEPLSAADELRLKDIATFIMQWE
jgi:alcohol dehydrogenase (cytochrome c)